MEFIVRGRFAFLPLRPFKILFFSSLNANLSPSTVIVSFPPPVPSPLLSGKYLLWPPAVTIKSFVFHELPYVVLIALRHFRWTLSPASFAHALDDFARLFSFLSSPDPL